MTIVNQLKKIVAKLSGKTTDAIQSETISGVLEEMSDYIAPAGSGGNGTTDHNTLSNRDLENQHPISAIEGLQDKLESIPERMTEDEVKEILKR